MRILICITIGELQIEDVLEAMLGGVEKWRVCLSVWEVCAEEGPRAGAGLCGQRALAALWELFW